MDTFRCITIVFAVVLAYVYHIILNYLYPRFFDSFETLYKISRDILDMHT